MAKNDVELVIRARNEASKAIDAISNALNTLTSAQANTGAGAQRMDGLLGELVHQFQALDAQTKGLQAFSKIAREMDSATAAVERLEKSVASAAQEQSRLSAAQSSSANEVSRLKAVADASKQAYDAEKARLDFLKTRVSKDSLAYQEQVQAVERTSAANKEANAAVGAAERQQRQLTGALGEASAALTDQQAKLDAAKTQFNELRTAAQGAGAALGGIVAEQQAVSAASQKTAADLKAVGDAIARQQAARSVEAPVAGPAAGPAAQATAAYRAQVQAVAAAKQAFSDAREEATRLGRELAAAAAPTNELKTAFLLAREASKAAEQSYLDQAQALQKLRGQSGGGFKQVIDLSESLKQVPAQETAVQRLLRAIGLGRQQVEQSNKPTGRKGEVLFGLRPYELQNLGFQVNDLITQIASGTAPSQAFAQQFGQIIQIFPKLGAVLLPILPELIGLGIALGVVGAAMGNVGDHAESVREFGGELAASADGAHHSAEALATAAHQLDVYGGSLKDARAAISQFVQAGLDDTKIERFGRSAQNMADIFGGKVPEAAEKMAAAFTHGYDAVKKLDDQFNFLSAAERQHIKELFESGQAEEARTEAFRIFERQMDAGAAKTRGPWTEAIRNLTQAWDNFLTFLANSGPIQGAIKLLGDLAQAAKNATANLPGAKPAPRVTGDPELDRELAQLKELQTRRDNLAKHPIITGASRAIVRAGQAVAGDSLAGKFGTALSGHALDTVSSVDRQIADAQKAIAQRRQAIAKAGQDATQAQLKADADVKDALQDQLNSLKGVNDARRVAVAGQKAYDDALAKGASQAGADAARALGQQIEQTKVNKENEARARSAASHAQALQNKLDSLEGSIATAENNLERKAAEGQTASLKERLDAIAAQAGKIKGDLAKFASLGGKDINGESISAFTARIDQNTKVLQQQETLRFYSEQINALEKQRQDRLRAIADQYAAGNISAADAFKQEQDAASTLTKQLADLAKTAGDFAKALPDAAADPKIKAFVDQMERLQKTPTTGTRTEAARGGRDLLAAEERALNDIVQERNATVETQNQLLDQGLITLDEWRQKVQGAYASTTPEIQDQIEKIRVLLDLLREQGAITDTTYDAWVAKLQLVGAETTNLTTQVLSVRDANDLLASAGTRGIESFLQKVVNGANVFQSFGQAVASTVADLLLQIGELILKQELLNLIMKSGAGNSLAGAVNGVFNVAPVLTAGAVLTSASAALGASGGMVAAAGSTIIAGAAALQAAAAALMVANSVGVLHGGGIVGSVSSRSRAISPLAFLGAPRFHSGTVVGLRSDEVPAILQRGEEVLSRNNPRNILNGGGLVGGPGGAPQDIANIMLLDPDMVPKMLASQKGKKIIFSHIMDAVPAIAQQLGRGR